MGMDARIIHEIQGIVGLENVISSRIGLLTYGYDATLLEGRADLVVFPGNTQQVAAVMSLAHQEKIPVTPRGGGTNLSGGSIPHAGGIVLVFTRMNKILEIDPKNRTATVEPGVTNMELQKAAAPFGFRYAPDPASQKVSTMGGNVGEGSGGMLGVKYGVTKDHVLGLKVVLFDGQIVQTGGKLAADYPELDFTPILVGSEGTLGLVTEVTVRLTPLPAAVKTMLAVYDRLEDAGNSVSAIVARGIIPATLELLDRVVIGAVEDFVHAGLPLDAEAVLLIEVDGAPEGLERQAEEVVRTCREKGAREVKMARTAKERELLWLGRRTAIGAIARLRPSYDLEDVTVPRNRLTQMLREVARLAREQRIQIGLLAHSGDGNLHPLMLFDERDKEETGRVMTARAEMFRIALEMGGTLSGEHGIGMGKLDFMPALFGPGEMDFMRRIKAAFDPEGLINPGKVVPPQEKTPDLPAKG
ncbi:MAG: FAD-binding protein [Firmicutes bacterium]|nr:FAD-binding protein [Bacillota bacterium]